MQNYFKCDYDLGTDSDSKNYPKALCLVISTEYNTSRI